MAYQFTQTGQEIQDILNQVPTNTGNIAQNAADISALDTRLTTAEGEIDAAQSDIVSLKGATTWESVTLIAGSNVNINMQQAYKLGKLLVVRANIQATATIAAYATLLTHGYSARCGWIAPIYSASFVPVEGKGIYADAGNTTIRNASSLPAGMYTISVIIPCT